MGRVVAIDFGTKRTGLAVTDPLQIIASPLHTVKTAQAIAYLKDYDEKEGIEAFVVGMPKDLMNRDTHNTFAARSFVSLLQKHFPQQKIHEVDERFTSKIAKDVMIRSGAKKTDRQQKAHIDSISAAIILQSYLEAKA